MGALIMRGRSIRNSPGQCDTEDLPPPAGGGGDVHWPLVEMLLGQPLEYNEQGVLSEDITKFRLLSDQGLFYILDQKLLLHLC